MNELPLRRLVLDACDGPFGSAIKSEHYAEEGARVIRLGNIGTGEWRDDNKAFLSIDYWRQLSSHHARPGDLIMAGLGDIGHPVGRACVVPDYIGQALVKADCYRMRLNPNLADARFIAAFLSSRAGLGQAEALAEGSTRRRLTLSKAMSIRVPQVSIAAQQSVADFLGVETTRIDTVIAKKRRLAELLSERRAGFVEQEIRGLADHYGELRLKVAVAGVNVGIVITPAAWYQDNGIPALRGLNVKPGRISGDDLVFLSAEGDRINQKSRLRVGDVVVVRTGQAGAAAVVTPEFDGANCIDLIIIKPGRLNPDYLTFVLNSDWTQKHIRQHSVGTIQAHFNISTMAELPLPVPPVRVQEEIVHRLCQRTGALDEVHRRLNCQIDLLQEHRQALITAAVTGELEVSGRPSVDA